MNTEQAVFSFSSNAVTKETMRVFLQVTTVVAIDLSQDSKIEGTIQHASDDSTVTLRIFDRGQRAEVCIPADDVELVMERTPSDDPATLVFTIDLSIDESN